MDLWTTLLAGHVSFVERTEGTRRQYLVVENAPERWRFRAFTPKEVDVVGFAARGLAAILTHDPRSRSEDVVLTQAERDALELLRSGLSNRAIAEQRGRSVRTIANQVGRLLQKLKAPSRRALVARVTP